MATSVNAKFFLDINESICYLLVFKLDKRIICGLVAFDNCSFEIRLPHSDFHIQNMVGVAQLVEPQVVALVVVGSSPITHPIKNKFGQLRLPVFV